MISKEQFLAWTDKLDHISETAEKRSEMLSNIFPQAEIWWDNDLEIDLILKMLTELVPESKWTDDDTYASDIEWFFYENRPVVATIDNKEYVINTWEELYDFLVLVSEIEDEESEDDPDEFDEDFEDELEEKTAESELKSMKDLIDALSDLLEDTFGEKPSKK